MSDKRLVDARGLSCPQPVLETKRVVDGMAAGEIDVLVDTVTSRENVIRFAENAGWSAIPEPEGDYYRVSLKK